MGITEGRTKAGAGLLLVGSQLWQCDLRK